MANKLICEDIEKRIHQLLDDRLTLTGDSIVMEHALSCADCRQLVSDYDEILTSPASLATLAASPIAPVLNGNDKLHAKYQDSFRQHLGLFTAIAAVLLLVIGVFSISNDRAPMMSASLPNSHATKGLAPNHPLTLSIAANSNAGNQIKPDRVTHAGLDDSEEHFIRQLVFFQPPTLVELAQSTPTLVHSVKLPDTTSSWQQISTRLDPLSPYLQYSAELPGVRNFHRSVSVTIQLLSQSLLSKEEENEPDLGWFPENHFFAAI